MSASISQQDFAAVQQKGEVTPIRYSLDLDGSLPETYRAVRDFDDSGYTFLLESAETDEASFRRQEGPVMDRRGNYSFIGFNPRSVVRVGDGEAEIEPLSDNPVIEFSEAVENGEIRDGYDPLDVLRDVSPDVDLNMDGKEHPFMGGLVGFHPYDMVYDIKPVERDGEVPQSEFVFADRFIAYDHVEGTAELVYTPFVDGDAGKAYRAVEEEAGRLLEHIDSVDVDIPEELEFLTQKAGGQEEYERMVEEVKEHVTAGDTYQTVISRKKNFDLEGEPLTLYSELRETNPSPYMYMLEFDGTGVLGASPETLVKTEGDYVETNPIAGTIKRGENPVEDRRLEGEILSDEKEISEHTMLVDLARNDLNRVAKPGSTEVIKFMEVRQYSTVQHIETDVVAELKGGMDRFDAMRSVFPAGTLSGAPKVRSMEIIADQEDEPRGLYGGAVAHYSLTGNVDSAITIRTSMIEKTGGDTFNAEVQAGAGIVDDSDPASEFRETNQKMGSITGVLDSLNGGGKDE